MIGGLRITPLLVIKTTVLLLVALWAGDRDQQFPRPPLQQHAELTPSIQVLIGKLIRIG